MKNLCAMSMALFCAAVALPRVLSAQEEDLMFMVLIKSSNYAQQADGELELLNYHFFAEVFPKPGGTIEGATIVRRGSGEEPKPLEPHGGPHYFEGGHFDSLAAVDAAFPNGDYLLSVQTPSGDIDNHVMRLEGDSDETEIPAPITISLWQEGRKIPVDRVDPAKDLIVRWSDYTYATPDPDDVVDDMIFVVIADCHGERIVHSGMPFYDEDYLTFEATEYRVPPGTLRPGEQHSMFVEFPRVMHPDVVKGVPSFTSFETATYMDLYATGESSGRECPDVPPPLDTGQTDR